MTTVSHTLLLVVANACLWTAGAGLTRALGIWSAPRELLRALGISYMVGLAFFGVAAQLLYVVGLPLPLWQSLSLCAIATAAGAVRGHAPARWTSRRRPLGQMELLAAGLVALMLLLLALDAIFQPLASWDAWTQWTPKARALVLTGGLNAHVLGSAVYRDWHLDYPLFVPATEAYAFRFIGIDVRVMHLQQWFFLFGFAFAFVDLLRPRVRPLFLWSVLLAIIWAPKIGGETIAANADMAMALFLGLAGIAAAIWIVDSDSVALALLAIFSAAVLASKLEGAYLVVILFATSIWYLARASRRRAYLTAAAFAVSLVGILPWKLWVQIQHLPATYSVHSVLAGPGIHEHQRGPIASLVLLGQFFSPRGFLLLAPLALSAVALVVRRESHNRGWALPLAFGAFVVSGIAAAVVVPGPSFPFPWRSEHWLVFIPALLAGAVMVARLVRVGGIGAWSLGTATAMGATFVVIYVLTPYPFAWHLGTSSARVVLGPALFLASAVPLLLEGALQETAGQAASLG